MRGDPAEWFVLILVLILSCWLIYVGLRNYRNPTNHNPVSPLGKYLSQVNRRAATREGSSHEEHEFVKYEAVIFILGGALMMSVILGTSLVLLVFRPVQ